MTVAALVAQARATGVSVRADGDDLVISGPYTEEMVAAFRANKPEVLALVRSRQDVVSSSVRGTAALSLAEWPSAENVCMDCGRKDATVLITTDYGARYCRRCLHGN